MAESKQVFVPSSGLRRVVSWNINGIRAIVKKEGSLSQLFKKLGADVICFQETKITGSEMEDQFRFVPGYESFWSFSKKRKGYSGVATYCRTGFTIDAKEGIEGMLEEEGRVIMTDHKHFIILNVYFPNGGREGRVDFKMEFYEGFRNYVEKLKETQKNIIILGDVNTAHKHIDIHQKKAPDCSGFLACERAWIDKLLNEGKFIDSFRHFHQDVPHCYTWWNQRNFSRSENKGWRIDYIFVPQTSVPQLENPEISEEESGETSDISSLSIITDNPLSIEESNGNTCATMPETYAESKIDLRSVGTVTAVETTENGEISCSKDALTFSLEIEAAEIMTHQKGSDHCPIYIELKNPLPKLPDHPPARLSSIAVQQKRKKQSLFSFFGPVKRKTAPSQDAPAAKKQKLPDK